MITPFTICLSSCVFVCLHVYFVRTLVIQTKSCFTKAELIQNCTEYYWGIVKPQTADWCTCCILKVKFIDVILMLPTNSVWPYVRLSFTVCHYIFLNCLLRVFQSTEKKTIGRGGGSGEKKGKERSVIPRKKARRLLLRSWLTVFAFLFCFCEYVIY